MKIRSNELIDHRNRDLWEYLQTKFSFELEESPESGFLTYFDRDTVIIEVDTNEMSPGAFTHELLHVFVKTEGLQISWDMKTQIEKDPELREIFSTSLRVHIGNCLEHVKMLPLFLARGFAREEFLMDYHEKIINESDLKQLRQNYYCEGKVLTGTVDKFIGKYFAMRASVNPQFDYSSLFKELQQIDPSLLMILDNFWEAWMDYSLGDPKEKYLKMLENFLHQIKAWKANSSW